MRKILMSLLLASLSLMVQAQGRYVIDGTVNNAPEGAVVKLFRNTGNLLRPVANDTITGSLFHFEGETTGDGVEPMKFSPCITAWQVWFLTFMCAPAAV